MALGLDAGYEVSSLPALTAVGVTNAVLTAGVHLCFQVQTASIGTNVVVRFEGSVDNDQYFNIDASGSDTTITTNGTTGYFMQAPVQYVRLRLVSISGGTPSVTCQVGCI